MTNAVLVIPESGNNSFVLPNVKFAVNALGITEANIRRAICYGCPVMSKGQKVFIDYEYDPDESDDEPVEYKKVRTAFNLTEKETGEVYHFPNMNRVSVFLDRSHGYLYKTMHDGAVLESRKDGKWYRIDYIKEEY